MRRKGAGGSRFAVAVVDENGPVSFTGDIVIDRPGFKFFCPITTMLILSVMISVIAGAMRR
jgi:hypothetical protein